MKKAILILFVIVHAITLSAQKEQRDSLRSRASVENASILTTNVNKIHESQMNNKDQVTNALDAIRGRVAGLQVERNGANALSAVRLRGTTSLTGGNDPLIIVDGVMGDLTLLSSVYPTDIESFTIMKDASETSQYGSRGAAGVIEVTTLRGKAGQMHVNYNGSFGISTVYKTLNMLTAAGYSDYAVGSLNRFPESHPAHWVHPAAPHRLLRRYRTVKLPRLVRIYQQQHRHQAHGRPHIHVEHEHDANDVRQLAAHRHRYVRLNRQEKKNLRRAETILFRRRMESHLPRLPERKRTMGRLSVGFTD